jgi:aspartyl-tRNA(Asn)/glutamyl-tRNA(Gln) amidotransferase subunit B
MGTSIKIGVEIHCQLTGLQSKLFCSCKCNYRNIPPNSNICPICSGQPGTLPLLNKRAVELACRVSTSLNCRIPDRIAFYRKNYFYLDLPKNFQITQYNAYGTTTVGSGGRLLYGPNGQSGQKAARIRRVQLEEDPGRLVYESGNLDSSFYTLIDYNRAGVALVEIVTEPDFIEPKDVRMFLNKISSILEHMSVSDTNLEGAVRCDANISIGNGKRVEIKNVSSFKEVEKALSFEVARQQTLSIHDIEVKAETRHWDNERKVTLQARTKEEEQDYRYFPEPDIPVVFLGKQYLLSLKSSIPELPDDRKRRLVIEHGLSDHVAQVLIDNKELADFFESAVKIYSSPTEIANWIVSDLSGFIDDALAGKTSLLGGLKVRPKHIAELAQMVDQNVVSRTTAKILLSRIIKTGEMPSQLMRQSNDTKIDDEEVISKAVESIFLSERSAVDDAKKNPNVANFLLGKVLKSTRGRADPKVALDLIKRRLDETG